MPSVPTKCLSQALGAILSPRLLRCLWRLLLVSLFFPRSLAAADRSPSPDVLVSADLQTSLAEVGVDVPEGLPLKYILPDAPSPTSADIPDVLNWPAKPPNPPKKIRKATTDQLRSIYLDQL